MNPIEIFKCLADKSRLRIINSLMIEPMYVELLAERLGLSTSTVSFHLKKLMDANMVSAKKDQYYTVYSLNHGMFTDTLGELVQDGRGEEELLEQREREYRDGVINAFFKYGKLTSIPVQNMKKRIVLEQIVENFKRNRTYTEKEVNLIIADIHEDFCTIRRDLLGFGLMERNGGIYKRL